ncbi:MAG: pyruvate ferredoxin oxidoreductase [Clostridia bacterium]|nr:MAG: pyruvate ferredoxin oxidoreductase [Clostridia bacterium]
MAKEILEGSRAVARAVAMCRPQVIAAYPITPQTHIVQELAQLVADGELAAEYVNVESEHSAASVILGASAAGVRVYTSTTSQGMLLMNEVLYNLAGLRLPAVMTCVNRAVSAPLNIWNDHQDSISVRDSGWMQFYAENNQEAVDLLLQAYRLAEDHRVLLPAMVCMDGYILSHAWEVVDIPTPAAVDTFLPPYPPLYRLDTENPLTFGAYAEPDKYTETRYMMQEAMNRALEVLPEIQADFARIFGRRYQGPVEGYRLEDAETVFIGMGSTMGTVKEAVDALRQQGEKVGAVRLIAYRPFPAQALYAALQRVRQAIIFDRAVSLGSGGPLATEVRALFQSAPDCPAISSGFLGLGGRDVTEETVINAYAQTRGRTVQGIFFDLRHDVEMEGVEG